MFCDLYNINFSNPDLFLKPVYIFISTSNRCNANCIFCDVHENKIVTGNINAFRLFDELHQMGTQYIHFMGGGEPFVDDKIWDYCKYLTEIGIKTVFTTNGYSVLDDGIQRFLENDVDTMFFSIDSHCAETHNTLRRKRGLWEKSIENIKQIKNARPDIKIVLNHVLNKRNVNDFEKFILLRKELPFDFINLIIVKDHSDLLINQDQLNDFLKNEMHFRKIASELKIGFLGGELLFNKKVCCSEPCVYPQFSAYIDFPTGGVFPCDCTIHREYDAYCCGNLLNNSFGEIWKGKRFDSLRKNLLEDKMACKEKCDMVNKYNNRQIMKNERIKT